MIYFSQLPQDRVNHSILCNMKLLEVQEQGRQKCRTTVKQTILPEIYDVLFGLYNICVSHKY